MVDPAVPAPQNDESIASAAELICHQKCCPKFEIEV